MTTIFYRWGPYGCEEFSDNLDQFLFDLPSRCQVFWLTTSPIAEETSAKGMSIPGLEQLHFLTRFHILEVNKVKFRKIYTFLKFFLRPPLSSLGNMVYRSLTSTCHCSLSSPRGKRTEYTGHLRQIGVTMQRDIHVVSCLFTILHFLKADDK